MPAFEYDRESARRERRFHLLGNVLRERFLQREPAREDVDHAREVAETGEPPGREIADVRTPEERQEVMRAQSVKRKIARDDEPACEIGIGERGDARHRVGSMTAKQFAEHLGDARRRAANLGLVQRNAVRREDRLEVARDFRALDFVDGAAGLHGRFLRTRGRAHVLAGALVAHPPPREDSSVFVFFDVGGTLLHAPRGLLDVVETLLLVERRVRPPDAIRDAIHLAGAGEAHGPLSRSNPDAFETLFRELDLAADAPRLAQALAHRTRGIGAPALMPGTYAALELLRAAGARLGVISNADEGLRSLLSSAGIERFFDTVVSSSRAGFLKPDRRIFEIALLEAGVPATEAWHVGDDSDADIRGARAVGMRTVWITDSNAGHLAARNDEGIWIAARPDEAAYRILDAEGRIPRHGAA
jgi:HAD superfamily hydrolase (TIGR01509 family)